MPRMKNTKQKIFDESVRLFSRGSYDSVSMRAIADAVGITEGGLYRHYRSKEEIMEGILLVFQQKFQKYILTKKQIDQYLETDTTQQLLERFLVKGFSEEDQLFMAQAFRIVYREHLVNPVAKKVIITQLYEETAETIQYTLDRLIESKMIRGRNTKAISHLWAQSIFATTSLWVSSVLDGKESLKKIEDAYQEVGALLIEIILSE